MVRKALEAADRNGRMGWVGFVGTLLVLAGLFMSANAQMNKIQREIRSDIEQAVTAGVSRSYPLADGRQLETRVEYAQRQMQRNTEQLDKIGERLELILAEVKK